MVIFTCQQRRQLYLSNQRNYFHIGCGWIVFLCRALYQKDEGLAMRLLILAFFIVSIDQAPPAYACAVCFGDPGSQQTKAAMIGVAVLLGVIGAVLACIAFTALQWARRAKANHQSF